MTFYTTFNHMSHKDFIYKCHAPCRLQWLSCGMEDKSHFMRFVHVAACDLVVRQFGAHLNTMVLLAFRLLTWSLLFFLQAIRTHRSPRLPKCLQWTVFLLAFLFLSSFALNIYLLSCENRFTYNLGIVFPLSFSLLPSWIDARYSKLIRLYNISTHVPVDLFLLMTKTFMDSFLLNYYSTLFLPCKTSCRQNILAQAIFSEG